MNQSKKKTTEKILVSACFLGERVRYNGEIKTLTDELLWKWKKQGRLIAVCPEVCGGLIVPRAPAEINPKTNQVITRDNHDVTLAFNQGAQHALNLCQQHDIKFALLKESSPSCGSNTIYDGSFTDQKIPGEGITTKLLRLQGIQVFCENTFTELARLVETN